MLGYKKKLGFNHKLGNEMAEIYKVIRPKKMLSYWTGCSCPTKNLRQFSIRNLVFSIYKS